MLWLHYLRNALIGFSTTVSSSSCSTCHTILAGQQRRTATVTMEWKSSKVCNNNTVAPSSSSQKHLMEFYLLNQFPSLFSDQFHASANPNIFCESWLCQKKIVRTHYNFQLGCWLLRTCCMAAKPFRILDPSVFELHTLFARLAL